MSTSIKYYITDEDIININDLVSELAVILRKFEIDLNPYQTDVYFYYDPDTNMGRLKTFINVGGNSWINDDHVTVYRDPSHYMSVYDYFDTVQEFADALEISKKDLIKAVRKFKNFDADDFIERTEVIDYIKNNEKLAGKITVFYIDYYVDDNNVNFLSMAQGLLSGIYI